MKIPEYGLTIPCHWHRETMRQMLDAPVPANGLPIAEVYGVLAHSPLMHGRATSTVPSVSIEEALSFREFIAEKGVGFTYLLNAPFSLEKLDDRSRLDDYLRGILEEFRPDALTVTSLELMRYVREKDGGIPIHVSTIAGVRNARELEPFLEVGPNRVVVHHDLGKDWKQLTEVVRFGTAYGIAVEVLITESCICHCPWRDAHYAHLGKPTTSTDLPFHLLCNTRKIDDPSEFLMAGGAIRPEDIHLLESRGVRYLKISGRDREANEMPSVVSAYQRRRYEGNFIDLLDVAPALHAGQWVHLNNRSLDGFLERYPQTTDEERKAYCEGIIASLYRQGNFSVSGVEYEVTEGKLRRKIPLIPAETLIKEKIR